MKPLRKKQTYETTVQEYIKGKVLGKERETVYLLELYYDSPARPSDKSSKKGKTTELYFFGISAASGVLTASNRCSDYLP
jgi:hypothetical protein